jgi:hypothetical protein
MEQASREKILEALKRAEISIGPATPATVQAQPLRSNSD